MLNVFVKDLGLGYKAGETLTWSTAQINALDGVAGATSEAVVTISTFDIQQLNVIETLQTYMLL